MQDWQTSTFNTVSLEDKSSPACGLLKWHLTEWRTANLLPPLHPHSDFCFLIICNHGGHWYSHCKTDEERSKYACCKGADSFLTWPHSSPSAGALWSGTCGGPHPPWPTTLKTDPDSSASESASWKRGKAQGLPSMHTVAQKEAQGLRNHDNDRMTFIHCSLPDWITKDIQRVEAQFVLRTHKTDHMVSVRCVSTSTYMTLIPATIVVAFHLCGPFISIGPEIQIHKLFI